MYETTNTEPPRVRVSLSYKINMGNYESLGVDFSVEDSAKAGETVAVASERVYSFVEKKLIEKVTKVREEMETGKA